MLRIILAILLSVAALPAEAQLRTPGNDFIPEAGWSEAFTQGMLAVHQRDFAKAEEHFLACVANEKKIDPNCEFYLAVMYQQKGDATNFRKWLDTAAQHGQAQAVAIVGVMERFK